MPRIAINLTLAELKLAAAQFVASTCEFEVNSGSLEFSYDADGRVVGASFDAERVLTQPPSVPDPSTKGPSHGSAKVAVPTFPEPTRRGPGRPKKV